MIGASPGEPEEGLHPETLVDQDIHDSEAFVLAGRPIVPEDIYDLPGTVHGLYSELIDNVDRLRARLSVTGAAFPPAPMRTMCCARSTARSARPSTAGAGTVLGAYADDTFMSPFFAAGGRRPRRHAPHSLGGRGRRGFPVTHL